MTSQTQALQFVQSYLEILEDRAASDDQLSPFVDALRNVDETPGNNVKGELDHPLMPLLEGALAAAEGPQELIESVIDLASEGGFRQVYEGEGINATQADYMVGKQIVGSRGRLFNEKLSSGIFFLAPNFEYPMHNHAGLEIYYVHSGVMHVQNGLDAEPRRVGPGEYSVTPSQVPHALYIGDAPVVILYIWTGDLNSPIYWLVEQEDGSWTKIIAMDFAATPRRTES
jgi:quercetin dioxygenase-like cupin family protein